MRWLRSILREVAGLFVDSGSLAIALLFWTVCAAVALPLLHAGHWGGPVLAAGFVLVLVENALRASRRL